MCLCEGVGWFGAGGIETGVEARQEICLEGGGGGGFQAKNIGCEGRSLNKFLQGLRSLLHHTIHLRHYILKQHRRPHLVYHPVQKICCLKITKQVEYDRPGERSPE